MGKLPLADKDASNSGTVISNSSEGNRRDAHHPPAAILAKKKAELKHYLDEKKQLEFQIAKLKADHKRRKTDILRQRHRRDEQIRLMHIEEDDFLSERAPLMRKKVSAEEMISNIKGQMHAAKEKCGSAPLQIREQTLEVLLRIEKLLLQKLTDDT